MSRLPDDLTEEFEVDATEGDGPGQDPADAEPDYNVAPTKRAPVVLERLPRDGDAARSSGPAAPGRPTEGDRPEEPVRPTEPVRWLRLLRWGLVPSWAKDPSVGNRMINARAETLFDKPVYRRAAAVRRCLVPADGWYEWQVSPTAKDAKGKPRKQPFFLRPQGGGPIAFAGLYELWRDPGAGPDDPAAWLASYVIITTAAEPALSAVHDRMPVVLPPERWDDWLDPRRTDPEAVRVLLAPPAPGRFAALPVSTQVNAVSHNGAHLVEPLPRDGWDGVVDPMTGELVERPGA